MISYFHDDVLTSADLVRTTLEIVPLHHRKANFTTEFHYAVKNSRVKLVFWLGIELCSTKGEIVKLFECLEL